jgi:hypothetical protein
MISKTLLFACAPLVLALGLGGCKQGEGDRCQVQSDCDDNLVCDCAPGADLVPVTTGGGILGGICRASVQAGDHVCALNFSGGDAASEPDASVVVDLATTDE